VAGPSKVVSFLKAGGGAGATTLAVQMACAASKDQPGTVLLIDLDLQFGSAALHLDLPQKTSVADLLASAERLDGPMLRAAAAHHPSGVDLLAAPAQVMPLDLVEPQTALSLLDAARAGYGLVLVELPQTWTRWTRAVLEASDAAVLAVNLTVPSLRHARRQLETITEEGLGHLPLSVVANRVREGLLAKPSAISRAEAERVIGRPIAATLPYDDLLFRTATLGQPVGGLPGGKALAKRFARMIEQVTIPVSSEVKP
jgi:pilus assembly protein CpaE